MNFTLYIAMISFLPQFITAKFITKKTQFKVSRSQRNEMLAFAYMIISLGPNVTAYSIIEIIKILFDDEIAVLGSVAIVGILIYYSGRRLRDSIHEFTAANIKEDELEKPITTSFSDLAKAKTGA